MHTSFKKIGSTTLLGYIFKSLMYETETLLGHAFRNKHYNNGIWKKNAIMIRFCRSVTNLQNFQSKAYLYHKQC